MMRITLTLAVGLFACWAGLNADDERKPLIAPHPHAEDVSFEDFQIIDTPTDVTDIVRVVKNGKLTKTTGGRYRLSISLANDSQQSIPGPLTLIIKSTNNKDVSLHPRDQKSTAPQRIGYLEDADTLGSLKKTKPQTIIFHSTANLTAKQIKDFDFEWSVERVDAKEEEKTASDKLVPGKKYTVKEMRRVMRIQEKHTNKLLAMDKEMRGTGITEDKNGNLRIIVYVGRYELKKRLPKTLDGVPVIGKIISPIYGGPQRGSKDSGTRVRSVASASPRAGEDDPKKKQKRPVPIGVSVGHPSITAGTLGCRVYKNGDDGRKYFILSNNHVLANSNNAEEGDAALQPGRADGGRSEDKIGTLSSFVVISFANGARNTMDAAIAATTKALTDFKTFRGGYGGPTSNPKDATVDLEVQKCGRTTGHTKAKITATNATINVNFGRQGTARFVGQIVVTNQNGVDFSRGGDSGSLVVDNDRNPVGLLFAGGGNTTILNPIKTVLDQFGVKVDDGSEEDDGDDDDDDGDDEGTSCIGNRVWFDANRNGIQDRNEPAVRGIPVRLFNSNGRAIASTRTNSRGAYGFRNLRGGTYTVKFGIPRGFAFTKKDEGDDDGVDSDANADGETDSFELGADEDKKDVDAGIVRERPSNTGRIGNRMWYDFNRNGVQDRWERWGPSGRRVELWSVGDDGRAGTGDDQRVAVTRTNRFGFYLFQRLEAGTYFVKFEAPSRFFGFTRQGAGNASTDSNANARGVTAPFELGDGQSNFTIDAGLAFRGRR